MKKSIFLILSLSLLFVSCDQNSEVAESRSNPQATSLLGEPLYAPEPTEDQIANFEFTKAEYEKNPDDADSIIWYGRRTAYLSLYNKAIEIFTEGIDKHPEDARFYRHRGHRYISIRQFDKAIADFTKAAELIDGAEDIIEPDGIPNAIGTPVSSLHTNIWYHLGLAYYLNNDLEKAAEAYNKGLDAAENYDMLVAFVHWQYMTLRRLGKLVEAEEVLTSVFTDMLIIENQAYHKLCLFYKGDISLHDLTDPESSAIMNDATAYGVANWHLYSGERQKAKEFFEAMINGKTWASFGHIAAEADYSREFKN